jgi:hypothetical protein
VTAAATDRRDRLLLAGRLLGVALTALMGWIHLRLWLDGYREVPVIGTLFVLNAIGAGLLVAALLTVPARLHTATAAITALFTAGTAAGLILSLTVGLFGVHESLQTPFVPTTLTVESAGVLVLGLTSILGLTSPSRPLASGPDAVQTTR